MRKRSVKNNRINEEVLRAMTKILRDDVKDPRVSPMTSVVLVEVAPDLKTAKVYVSVLGDEETAQKTIAGLRSSARFIRGRLAHSVNLRNTPELTFILDDSIAYGVHMSQLLDEVTADDARRDAEAAGIAREDEELEETDSGQFEHIEENE